ncbi:hypothetical protein [Rufibacter sediminis]|nr:hypothetical protein [Rufibacter sediminis]
MNARTLHLSKGTAINPADDSSNKPAMNPLHKPTEKPVTVTPPDEAKESSLPDTVPKENKQHQFPNLDLTTRGAT